MTKLSRMIASALIAWSLCLQDGFAVVFINDSGTWPETWPVELQPHRVHAKTYGVATGTQEDVYEITFDNREEFERIWPVVLSLKSPGATLVLDRVIPGAKDDRRRLFRYDQPAVRIHTPLKQKSTLKSGLALGPPWPESLVSATGVLPEYVVARRMNNDFAWVATEPGKGELGFHFRARIDLALVVDGTVIDLNRIALPPETPIVDRRWPSAGK